MFKFMVVFFWLCMGQLLFANSHLTEDSRSVPAALGALLKQADESIAADTAKIATAYKELSTDSQYKNAHKVYRLLAAMTLAGDNNLLGVVDKIWASGLKKDNSFLKAIGCEWGTSQTNESEKKIYRSRFDLEVCLSPQKPQFVAFALQQDWNAFSYKSGVSSSNTAWAPYYAQLLGTNISSWWNSLYQPVASQQHKAGSKAIKALNFNGKKQTIYGTDDIEPSDVACGTFYSQYPRLMVIGSHEAPYSFDDAESAVAVEVAKDCYVVIAQPSVLDNPVLRPHYRYSKEDLKGLKGVSQETHVEIRDMKGDKMPPRTIEWTVQEKGGDLVALPDKSEGNDGSLNDLEDVKNNDLGGYALTVWATHSDKSQESYYYWVPNMAQMAWIQEFVRKKQGGFTFSELVNDALDCTDLDSRIKKNLVCIEKNALDFF